MWNKVCVGFPSFLSFSNYCLPLKKRPPIGHFKLPNERLIHPPLLPGEGSSSAHLRKVERFSFISSLKKNANTQNINKNIYLWEKKVHLINEQSMLSLRLWLRPFFVRSLPRHLDTKYHVGAQFLSAASNLHTLLLLEFVVFWRTKTFSSPIGGSE